MAKPSNIKNPTTIEQHKTSWDDHVLLARVIANPLYEAATVNGGTLEGVEWDGAPVFDWNCLSQGDAGKRHV